MPKKKLYNKSGIVYSTAEDFSPVNEKDPEEFLPKEEQRLSITLDKKNRGGKTVTLVKGFSMEDSGIEELAKSLKSFCGSGGSAKDNEIIIQGDHKEKILQWLLKNGYRKSRKI
ncbi:MAG: translation initiation factor [Ginsengibacter sp.]